MTFEINRVYQSKNQPNYRVLILSVGRMAVFARCVSDWSVTKSGGPKVGDEFSIEKIFADNFHPYVEPPKPVVEKFTRYLKRITPGSMYTDNNPTCVHPIKLLGGVEYTVTDGVLTGVEIKNV